MDARKTIRFGRLKAKMLSGQQGVTAVEYALLLPILLAFVIGIIDVSRVIWIQATLNHATEAAARCGAVDAIKCGTPDAIKAYAVNRAAGIALQPSTFTVAAAACGTKVTASYPVVLTLPWNGTSSITLAASACYPI